LHTLKGNAGTLGIERIAYQAKLAEQKLKNNLYTAITSDLDHLQKLFTEFQNNYKRFIN
jgi:HPt (histidine-containing phosphotransfer) domain-containing protein